MRDVTALALLAGFLINPVRAQPVPEAAAICSACHGEAGKPITAEIPVIWGQNEGYLYLQLRDMKRGVRQVEQMAAIVEGLDKQQMLDLAAYFAAKPWPNLAQPDATAEATHRAQADNNAIGCTGCHLDGYMAAGAGSVPRLAGQQHDYLAKTMAEFRTGVRANNPGMTDLMKACEPDDFPAIAAYLAGL